MLEDYHCTSPNEWMGSQQWLSMAARITSKV